MKSVLRLTVVLVVMALVLGACGNTATSTPAPQQPAQQQPTQPAQPAQPVAGKRPQVGLVMKSLANEYFKVMGDGALAFQKQDGTFDLTMAGMNSETDIDTQINAMENFISKKADLIVLAPADSVGLVPSVKKALDAGSQVVNIDVKLDDKALADAGIKDLLFVGPDNAAAAKLSGDALGKKLGPGGKVIILEGNPGADNATQRKNGFMQSIDEYKLNLLDSVTAHWDTEEANTVMTNLLTKHPDVQGVMTANDSMALGVIKALDAAGKAGKVQVVSFDNIPAVKDLLLNGKMLATVDQYGPDQAKFGIQNGIKLLNGEKLSGWIKTPVKLITAAEVQ